MIPSYQILTGVTNSPRIQGLKTTLTVFWYRDNFNSLLVLTTLVGLIAFVSPDSLIISPKVYERKLFITYHILGIVTIPAIVTRSIGLPAIALLSWFLHHRRDNFIISWQILLIYRDKLILTTLSWHENPAHLPGLCKNSCQPRRSRQLNLPAGRYQQLQLSRWWGKSSSKRSGDHTIIRK